MKIFQNKILITALATIAAPYSVLAQSRDTDTTFKSQSLNFYSTYKPEIAPAPKPDFVPTLPVVDTSKPNLQYQVPEQTVQYSYKAEPIKPVALQRQKVKKPFENYAKLGVGTQGTFLLDAGVGSLMGNNYDAAIHFNHLSQKGNNSNIENQKWSQNTLEGSGNVYLSKQTLHLGLQLDRRAYRQYGYSNFLYSYEDKEVRNVYSGLLFNIDMTPVGSTVWDLKYKPEVRIYLWNSQKGGTENNLDFSLPVSKTIDSNFSVSLALNAGLASYASKAAGASTYGNNFFQINPAVSISYEGFKAKLGIKPTFATTSNYVLPDIQLSGAILDNALKLHVGWEGQLNQNTYRSLSLFNPFMDSFYLPKQGRLSHIYGGFETGIGNNISFGGTIGYKMWKNFAMFENDYAANLDGKQFKVIYEDINAFVIDAKFQYQINEQFNIKARSIWNMYSAKKVGVKAIHMPGVEINGGFSWQPIPKLWVGADVFMYDRIFAVMNTGLTDKLKAIVDLNANASYDVHDRVGLFLQAENILNQRYQYWHQYQKIGFTLVGGVRFKF